jgi:hypothetical protein
MPTVKSKIGVFSFDGNGWLTTPSNGALVFIFAKSELSTDAIARAESLGGQLETYQRVALEYASAADDYAALAKDGKLELEGIDFTEILEDQFGLTFGVKGKPDFTVSVEFRDGRPVEIWGAD